MSELTYGAFVAGVVAYSAAAILYFLELAQRTPTSRLRGWSNWVLGLAAIIHAAEIVVASLLTRTCPVESLHFALSLSALIVATAYLFARTRWRVHALGVVVAPLALLFLVMAHFVGASEPAASVPRALLALHVSANVSGVALFLLAGAAAVFYLVEERRFKSKKVNRLASRLPPLEALERMEHRLLLAGFPLLTLGIVTGAVFGGELATADGAQVMRALLAYGAWGMVATVLTMRALAGWRGRRAAYGTVAGAFCVLLVILLYISQPGVGAGL